MRIIAVIPTFNEENKIVSTIEALESLAEITEIIVADDDSSDRTVEKALETKASVIKHDKNIGKGESLNAVLKKLDKTACDGVILADGDLGKSASEFKRLIDNFEKNKKLLIVAG
ncbi:MAG TPA: glycosyltransferase, partial [Actinobacteria bacterium]|nr:glycosyltransferase [Actinomycetota bacterium]